MSWEEKVEIACKKAYKHFINGEKEDVNLEDGVSLLTSLFEDLIQKSEGWQIYDREKEDVKYSDWKCKHFGYTIYESDDEIKELFEYSLYKVPNRGYKTAMCLIEYGMIEDVWVCRDEEITDDSILFQLDIHDISFSLGGIK